MVVSASASAPGKLILFGEHAVVHGQPAIAASLSDLRIHASATTRADGMVQIDMPDLKPRAISFCVPAESIRLDQQNMSNHIEEKNLESMPVPSKEDALEIRETLQSLCLSHERLDLEEFSITALTPLIYLLNFLVPMTLSPSTETHGLTVSVKSFNLPVGAGLGSSAAFGVACSAALLKLRLLLLSSASSGIENSVQKICEKEDETCSSTEAMIAGQRPSSSQLDLINKFSFNSETLIHGTPSGIDNAVSTYGGAIYFTKNIDNGSVSMEKFSTFPSLDIILTNTNVPRSTKKLVANVKELKDEFPHVIEGILDGIGGISRSFRDMIESSDQRDLNQKKVSKLIQINQDLLCAIGVSHPSLDALCILTRNLYEKYQCTTKLTGAGGGGCAFTFFERLDSGENHNQESKVHKSIQGVKEVIESFVCDQNGDTWKYSCLTSSVGGSGVLWS